MPYGDDVSVWRCGGLVAVVLLGAGRAVAQPEASPAGAGVPLSIWYRSSEGCPEGATFVARLAELGRQATLARVGDRVDFVVTVAAAADASSGRLERQTSRGTVAIRELDAARCEDVTEALALSLEIALEPANETAAGAGAPASTDATRAGGEDRAPERARAAQAARVLQLGARGSLAKGIAPGWAPGGALFAALRAPTDVALAGRVSLGMAGAADTVAGVDVDVLWLGGRFEGCVFELGSGALSLQPCAGVELGMLRASSSGGAARSDRGFWGAGLGLLRGSLELDPTFALEAEVGAALPFVRYAVGSSLGGDLFRTEPVVAELGVGARWSP